MFKYDLPPEDFANQVLQNVGYQDDIIVNPDEIVKSVFCMEVIYSDSCTPRVNYAGGYFEIPIKYMGNKVTERFVVSLLLFKMFYRDGDKDANTTEYDMASANEFISTILMPEKEFTRLYSMLTIEELAKLFQVTETYVRYRANRLNLLNS